MNKFADQFFYHNNNKPRNMTNNFRSILSVTCLCSMMVACGEYESFSYDEPSKEPETPTTDKRDEAFIKAAGGPIDPNQTWISASTLDLNIATQGNCQINVYTSGSELRECFKQKKVLDNGTIRVSMPQGYSGDLLVECIDAKGEHFYETIKSSELSKPVNINFARKMTGLTRAAYTNPNNIKDGLISQSFIKDWGYYSFPGDVWDKLLIAAPEATGVNPNSDNYAVNYKLVSRGPFYVCFAYGDTGTGGRLNIGYYHYKEGDLSTFDFVPIAEALYTDYYYHPESGDNNLVKSKVQFSLKDNETTWYDTNFDHYDTPQEMSKVTNKNRQNDDAYNVTYSYNNNKGNIDRVRGLVYQIDVPVGDVVGFYLTRTSNDSLHRQKLIDLGIRSSVVNNSQKFMGSGTFTESRLNYSNAKAYRSLVRYYDGFIFMGLDDNVTGGDYDCNDVTFCLIPGGNGILPGVYFPYILDNGNPDKPHDQPLYYNPDLTKTEKPTDTDYLDKEIPWTFAFEDKPTSSDFDFNDVVIQVFEYTNQNGKHSADFYLCSAGGTLPAKVYFRNQLICEDVHKTLGGTLKNTGKETVVKHVKLGTVTFDSFGYDFGTNAKDLKIVVTEENSERTIDINTRATEESMAPLALVMKSFWNWPTENTSIFDAYKNFGGWVQNYADPKYMEWYKDYDEAKVTKFNKNGEPVKQ